MTVCGKLANGWDARETRRDTYHSDGLSGLGDGDGLSSASAIGRSGLSRNVAGSTRGARDGVDGHDLGGGRGGGDGGSGLSTRASGGGGLGGVDGLETKSVDAHKVRNETN